MLNSERATPEIEHQVINAFPHAEHRGLAAVFEHGHWWITCNDCGAQWSVVDTNLGFDFEQVTIGDYSC